MGMKKLKPGIYPDMPFPEYLAHKELISNSFLGRLDECPAKSQVEMKETDALVIGRATHAFILEGEDVFNKDYAVKPEGLKRNTKVGKAAYGKLLLENPGKEIIKEKDFLNIQGMREAVFSHPLAKDILAGGAIEQTIVWKCQVTGVLCKSRVDLLPNQKTGTLVDLKTTRSASERFFSGEIINRGYHRGAAFYLDAAYNSKIGKVGKNRVYEAFAIVAVEKEPPYMTNCFFIKPGLIEKGREDYIRLLKLNIECQKNGFYPHYTEEGFIEVDVPLWMQ